METPESTNAQYLGRHPTPEVGICGAGLEHGSHNGLVFTDELPQDIGVGQEVIAIHSLESRWNEWDEGGIEVSEKGEMHYSEDNR